MLPLWPERIRILLQPHQVTVSPLARWPWQRSTRQQQMTCRNESADWRVPLASAQRWLHDNAVRHARVQCVLSHHFVRYALVPWNDRLSGEEERQAYLRHCYSQAYGEVARQWDLRMQSPAPDEPSLASAVDADLLTALQTVVRDAGLKLEGIHPYLMVCANHSRPWVRAGDVWLVAIERGRLCLAWLQRGVWQMVRSCALADDELEQVLAALEMQLARESALCGDIRQDWPVVLYWPGAGNAVQLTGRRVTQVAVEGLI